MLYQVQIAKAGTTLEVDWDELPKASQERVMAYGLKQILNDSVSSVSVKDLSGDALKKAQAVAKMTVEEVLDNLFKGILKKARMVGGSDPVAAEAKRIAIAKLRKAPVYLSWLAENKLKPTDADATSKLAELANKLATREDIVALAEANVAARDDIDIGDLDI